MEYVLYDIEDTKFVPLIKEIDYIQNYIEIEKLRFENVEVSINLESNIDEAKVPPLLLISFLENAFKHGTGIVQNPEIEIELKAENGKLYFIVKNKFIETETIKDKTSGIGLTNVKRRLELLYHNRHHFTINKSDNWFIASLELTFKS